MAKSTMIEEVKVVETFEQKVQLTLTPMEARVLRDVIGSSVTGRVEDDDGNKEARSYIDEIYFSLLNSVKRHEDPKDYPGVRVKDSARIWIEFNN